MLKLVDSHDSDSCVPLSWLCGFESLWRHKRSRSLMDSEHFATNEEVAGSSPAGITIGALTQGFVCLSEKEEMLGSTPASTTI